MNIDPSSRTVLSVTAKDLLNITPTTLDVLTQRGFTLAGPIRVQVSAKAARSLILDIYSVGQQASIKFSSRAYSILVHYSDRKPGWDEPIELPVEHLINSIWISARQLARAIKAKLTKIQYVLGPGGVPFVQVLIEP